jgi:hypothetical protein
VLLFPALLLLLLGGDPRQDPMDKPGTWRLPPAGLTSNDENLRTMLVNPNDLVAGTGTNTSTGSEAAAPVRRLITGQRAKLPSSAAGGDHAGAQQLLSGSVNATDLAALHRLYSCARRPERGVGGGRWVAVAILRPATALV